MDFERTPRKPIGNLILTPMIDVVFMLIIFFMLTSSFMRVESLELLLPSAGAKATGPKKEVVHLFIEASGDMVLGQRHIDAAELNESLARMFEKDPGTRIMLLTAEGVTMQQLVNVMDRVYSAGGRSMFVRKWETKNLQGGAG